MCLLVNQIFNFLFNFTELYSVSSCAIPGIFVWVWGGGGGGPGASDIKKTLFFVCFSSFVLVLRLFYRSPMDNFKENYNFSRFQRRSNIFKGWPTFSNGVQLLVPHRNGYNLWFSRGVQTPYPTLWICIWRNACEQSRTSNPRYQV